MKTLLVEDNPADARLIREMLKESTHGTFQVQHAARLDAALERLRQETFDVVLLDLGLPDSQGLNTLTLTQEATRSLPIVVLTGLDDTRFALEALRAGAQDYLVKGRFDTELLVRIIRYAVERKQAEEEIRLLNADLERRVIERTAQLQSANNELLRENIERKRSDEALSVSEERYRLLFQSIQEGFYLAQVIFDDQGKCCDALYLDVNPAFEQIMGRPRDQIIGHRMMGLQPQINRDWLEVFEKVSRTGVAATHQSYSEVFRKHFEALVFRPTPGRFGVLVNDITERKRAENELHRMNRTLRALGFGSHALVNAQAETELLNEVCRIIVDECGHAMVWIGFAEEDEARTVRPVASAGFEAGYLETLRVTWADTERGRGPTGTSVRTGRPIQCANMLTDPKFAPWRAEALKRGYASSLALPLLGGGKAFGAVTIYSGQPMGFSEDEVKLLSVLTADLAQGITALRLRAAQARTEAALAESEARFRTMANAMPQLAWMARGDGHIDWYNQRWYDFTGTTPEQMEGWGWQSAHDPEALPKVLERWKVSLAMGDPFEMEFPLRGADGRYRQFLTRGHPLKDAAGRVLQWFGTNTDITEHKQIEDTLRFLAQRGILGTGDFFQELARFLARMLSMDYVCIDRLENDLLTARTLAVFHNGAFEDNITYALKDTPCGDVVGKTICCFPKEVAKLFPQDAVLREMRAESYLGTTLWSSAGRPIGLIAVIGRQPLTDTRLAESVMHLVSVSAAGELERRQAETALRHSEERYRSLVEVSPDALFVNRDNRIVFVNPAALRLFGAAAPEQLLGKSPFDVFHPDYHDGIRERIRRLRAGDRVIVIEEKIVRLDGAVVDVEVAASPFTDQEGPAIQVILRDITTRKLAEERLQASLREKDVMLKEIHHRVKNNLQVISSLVSLQADGIADPGMLGQFQDVRDRVRSMALVHEKLYQSESLARVDFAEYARSLLTYLWRAHGSAVSGIQLNLDLKPVPLSVDTAVPCGLILNELAVNAIKHAFGGRAEGIITTSLGIGPDGRVRLSVRDNGVGMPAGLDWRQSRSLGLRLVQMLAEQLQGTVEVNTGGGTEFLICFAPPETRKQVE